MKKNRIIAGLSAIMMGATMMASTAMSASAADYDVPVDNNPIIMYQEEVVNYTSAAFYSLSSGNPAPFGMSTMCIDSVTTSSDGSTVTIKLKENSLSIWSWTLATATIEGCENSSTHVDYFNSPTTSYPYGSIVIPTSNLSSDSTSDYVNVTVTFGGDLADIIDDIPAMSNPMNLKLRLFES